MRLSSDQYVLWSMEAVAPESVFGFIKINATLLFTWLVMVLLALGSFLITRNLSTGAKVSHWQNILEVIVEGIQKQIATMTKINLDTLLCFVGTMFLFMLVSNVLTVVPGFIAPTGSLSTTTAFALCVFFAVPFFGIKSKGLVKYLRKYIEPNPILLPLNVIGDFSQTISLAVRLYGNIMSGTVIGLVLLGIMPLFFPILMQLLGLISGVIQAYIFSVLTMVYITAATAEG